MLKAGSRVPDPIWRSTTADWYTTYLRELYFGLLATLFPQGLFIRSLRRRGKGVSSSRAARAQGGDNRLGGGSQAARSNQAFAPENLESYPRKCWRRASEIREP